MITRCVEKPGTRKKTVDADGVDYEYVLSITTNSDNDDENTILNYWAVPRYASPYINKTVIDASALMLAYSVDAVGYRQWEMTCRFTSRLGGAKKLEDDKEEPTQWPTEIHWSSKRIETFPPTDVNGDAIVNSAGDSFRNPPAIEIYHAIVKLTRYEPTYNPVRFMKFAGKINSTNWFACHPYTAKMEWPEADLTYIEKLDRYVWKISYGFEIAPEGWFPKKENKSSCSSWVADRGPRWWSTACERYFLMTDGDDVHTGGEDFLDGKGRPLYTEDHKPGQAITPVMLPFYLYTSIDFNQLRLP